MDKINMEDLEFTCAFCKAPLNNEEAFIKHLALAHQVDELGNPLKYDKVS